MRAALGLYQRPAIGSARLPYDINALARGYKRATRAIGGYWTGSFDISGDDATPGQLREFFDTWLGCVVKEYTGGIVTWEGLVYSMNLVLDGAEYHLSLEPDWFHNDTEVVYSSAAVTDINQGALSYTTESGPTTFTDSGQDFTDWETASGEADYQIYVVNNDATESRAYLGSTVSNDEIYVFQDESMTTYGWNVTDPSGKTPVSYKVIKVVDSQQGSLSYTDEGGNETFTDSSQSWAAWATAMAPALYQIYVQNNDATLAWAYLGANVSSTEIYVYQDLALTTPGWNGTSPSGKTPFLYNVVQQQDSNQAALSYTEEPAKTFTDSGQDFTAWQTTSGDAAYRIQVANSNGTVSWAYLGAIVGATEVYVYKDQSLILYGWNDQDPTGLTPSSYQVIQVSLENSRATTGRLSDADSQAEFGRMEYIVSLAGASSTAAAALRARHAEEFSWPRARFINQGRAQNSLSVTLAGFWYTLFWRYRRTSQTAAANALVSAIVAESEWVSAGRVDANALEVTADAYPIPQRIGNLLERVAEHGDASGNAWRCGVYAGRKLHYEQSPTSIEYYTRGGRLLDRAGQVVVPEFVTPGVLVQARSNSRITPPGAPAWARSGSTYVDQVEYNRDTGALRLSLADEPFSIITLTEQIQSGAAQ